MIKGSIGFCSMQDLDVGTSPYATPGSIGPPSSAGIPPTSLGHSTSASSDSKETQRVDDKSPREEFEDDPRPQPEYDMVFRQAVSAEDVYLGMGNKNPTTASCEELVVRDACQ